MSSVTLWAMLCRVKFAGASRRPTWHTWKSWTNSSRRKGLSCQCQSSLVYGVWDLKVCLSPLSGQVRGYLVVSFTVPCSLSVIAVGFWIHCLERTQVQTSVLELDWSELKVVVAWEGGHGVGRGPSSCLVWTTYALARLHLKLGQQKTG